MKIINVVLNFMNVVSQDKDVLCRQSFLKYASYSVNYDISCTWKVLKNLFCGPCSRKCNVLFAYAAVFKFYLNYLFI